jgi:hypothetical protein
MNGSHQIEQGKNLFAERHRHAVTSAPTNSSSEGANQRLKLTGAAILVFRASTCFTGGPGSLAERSPSIHPRR